MSPEKRKPEKAAAVKEQTFTCKFCQTAKPIGEMVVITRFMPPLITCRDCEKKLG